MLGSNDSFLAESFVINWAHRAIPKFKSRCPNALRDPSRPNIWGRTRLDRLDVGVTAINFWSARPDLNFSRQVSVHLKEIQGMRVAMWFESAVAHHAFRNAEPKAWEGRRSG